MASYCQYSAAKDSVDFTGKGPVSSLASYKCDMLQHVTKTRMIQRNATTKCQPFVRLFLFPFFVYCNELHCYATSGLLSV